MKNMFTYLVIYLLIIITHLVLIKMKEINKMKKELTLYKKTYEIKDKTDGFKIEEYKNIESFNPVNEIYDETLMKKDLLSFINNPEPSTLSVDQKQELDNIYKQTSIDENTLERTEPNVKDNRLLSIDTLNYENDKEMNTGLVGDNIMAFDNELMEYSAF